MYAEFTEYELSLKKIHEFNKHEECVMKQKEAVVGRTDVFLLELFVCHSVSLSDSPS